MRRRDVLSGAAAALGAQARQAPSDKLNLAGIGVGGVCQSYLRNLASENIMALCDVDDAYAAPTFNAYPQAKRYRDFRRMLEKEKGIDGVVIGTPDHSHAVIAMAAMSLGKHVYCAKPLTRTVHEARALARAARENKVATQMSVQSSASEGACATAEWVQSGVIGPVREVHVWSDRPIWPQGLTRRPQDSPPVPSTLDWDLWLGPAPQRAYHPAYHPWIWRGWWDFGTGALGDMGCHTLHVIFRALNLEHPASVHASSPVLLRGYMDRPNKRRPERVKFDETAPACAMVTWDFPARGNRPAVQLTWYDGGLKPPRPVDFPAGKNLPNSGILFVGDRGAILSAFHGGPSLVLPEKRMREFEPPKPTLPRTAGHYQEFIAACKGGPPPTCRFEFGALLTEVALLGNIAVRTGRFLEWDPENMSFRNDADANRYLRESYREGW